jgi:glycyl-tRNA synthetase (class II)
LSAGSVTVRERDSCAQTRVGVTELADALSERLGV